MLAAMERAIRAAVYINQGRRTIAEQWAFWNHYRRYGWPVAAYPSQSAPHIKYGWANHALDANNSQRIANYYRAHGVPMLFNVRGEPWHEDPPSERALLAAANRLAGKTGPPVLRRGAKGVWVKRAQVLLRRYGYRSVKVDGVMGARTVWAVKRLQRRFNIKPVDGVIGPRTWTVLRKKR